MLNQVLRNRYQVTARLGKGAMGEVFRATEKAVLIEWGYRLSAFTEHGRRVEVPWDAAAWESMETGSVLRTGGAGIPAELRQLLDEIASQRGKRYALFAVRPSGFKSFASMRALCEQRQIRVGYDTIGEKSKVGIVYGSEEGAR